MKGITTQPTEEERRLVRAFSGFGIPQEDIARQVGVDAKTLRKHFRDELDRGSVEATAKVAQSLFQMATTGKNVAAAIFWMKARAGWTERHRVKHDALGGRVALAVITGVPRAEDLSDDDLARIAAQGLNDDDDDEAVSESNRALTEDEWLERYSPSRNGA
jgi:hypothetical protein